MDSSIATAMLALDAAPVGPLLETALRASALVLVAGLAAMLLRRASAATRHLVWSGAAAGLLLLPILSWTVPAWRIPVVPMLGTGADVPVTDAHAPAAADPTRTPVEIEIHATAEVHVPLVTPVSEIVEVPVVTTAEVGHATHPTPGSTTRWLSLTAVARMLAVWFTERVPAVLALWASGALLVSGWLALGLIRARTLIRTAAPLRDPALAALADRLVERAGLEGRVRILESERSLMPMACGIADPVVLLPAVASEWPSRRQRDVLLHELAHVRRRDCLANVVAVAACAVHWFNPLAWHALRQLRAESERAADDAALANGARATDYAESLLEVARTLRGSALAPAAGIAMARPSQLEGRLLAILDRRRSRREVSRAALVPAAAGMTALVVSLAAFTPVAAADRATPAAVAAEVAEFAPVAAVAPVAPFAEPMPIAPPEPPAVVGIEGCLDPSRPSRTNSHTSNTDDDRRTIQIRRDGCEIEVEMQGTVRFNRTLTGIESISPGGSFEIETEEDGVTRRLRIRATDGGQLTHEFWIDGDRRPFDDTARAWLADTLLALERYTGFAADVRVPQLLEQGGVDAVLREIAQMPSDHAQGRYFALVLERELPDAELERVIRLAGREIDSDHELAQILMTAAQAGRFDARVHPAYLDALATIGSDYEHRRTLAALLQRDRLAPEVVTEAIRSAAGLDSDYELAELLIAIAGRYPLNGPAREAYLAALQSVDSDYELRRVLSAFIAKGELSAQETATVLEAATSIGSDYEQAELLLSLMKSGRVSGAGWPALMQAARTIDSDYERGRVLSSLLTERLADDRVLGILEAAEGIDSDHELAELLTKIARTQVVEGAVREAFLRVADGVASTYEYGRVMDALRRKAAL